MDPLKTNNRTKVSLLYLLFLSGLGFLSLDLISFPSDQVLSEIQPTD